jgi:hypothetical protein
MNSSCHVAVVGAGVAGLATAALLAQSKQGERLKITLIDARARAAYCADGDVGLRVSAIATGSVALLQDVGAWPAVLKARYCAYDRMRVWDESSTADSGDALNSMQPTLPCRNLDTSSKMTCSLTPCLAWSKNIRWSCYLHRRLHRWTRPAAGTGLCSRTVAGSRLIS